MKGTAMRLAVFAVWALVSCEGSGPDGVEGLNPAQLPTGHPPLDVGSLPPMPSGEITGRLELKAELQSRVSPGDAIFLMARNAATGQTIAVARLSAPQQFPLAFTLNGNNVMMQGMSLAGKVRLLARIDKDGDAISKNPGDIAGEIPELVQVPATGVVLVFDKLL